MSNKVVCDKPLSIDCPYSLAPSIEDCEFCPYVRGALEPILIEDDPPPKRTYLAALNNLDLKIKKLYPWVELPRYMTEGSIGMDLVACSKDDPKYNINSWLFHRFDTMVIGTGIAIEIPKGYGGFIYARSGLAIKKGLRLANSVGVIDFDYRGEVKVAIYNQSNTTQTIDVGDRIAQLVIAPVTRVEITEVDELSNTKRGSGGFGHTGD
jgi:dUTP pyrophosphatase